MSMGALIDEKGKFLDVAYWVGAITRNVEGSYLQLHTPNVMRLRQDCDAGMAIL